MVWRRSMLIGLAVALALIGAGCGSDGPEQPEATPGLVTQDPGAVHVHGLGYDSAGGVLYIATHTGMFELPTGASRARRIGDSRQDTMGFALVEPQLFLGSGHPDLRSGLPSHLGLIRSVDRGRSWEPVSLLGETDFHVLRTQGAFVYGVDARSGLLFVSRDSGRSWKTRRAPEALLDLVVDPSDPAHVLASGESVLYESSDGGRSWKVVANGLSGSLAWPSHDVIYVAAEEGAVFTAPSPTGPWRLSGRLGGAASALLATGRRTLFAALHDGTILRSADGGTGWTVRARP